MLAKFKGALINAVGSLETTGGLVPFPHSSASESRGFTPPDRGGPPAKHPYGRPQFLQLNSEDEIQVTADHSIRPIIVPRDHCKLPWNSGYAECINAGKSLRNEDQAAVHRGLLKAVFHPDDIAAKVVEMMPTIPGGTSRQQTSSSNTSLMSSSTSSPSISSTPMRTLSTVIDNRLHSKLLFDSKHGVPGVAHQTVNGSSSEKSNEGESIVNGVEASEEDNDDEELSSSSSKREDIQSPSNPVTADGMMSPTEPLPLNEILSSSSSSYFSPSSPHPRYPTPQPDMKSLAYEASHHHRSSVSSTLQESFSGFLEESLPYTYFGMFDGHAGSAVAVASSLTLHKIIHDKLRNITDLLVTFGLNSNNRDMTRFNNNFQGGEENENNGPVTLTTVFEAMSVNHRALKETPEGQLIINHDSHLPRDTPLNLLFPPGPEKLVTVDSLIIGALEASFWEMDHLIGQDKRFYKMPGGCTVLVSLFILGKVYVANAGDSRCILSRGTTGQVIPMSFDFTPESERERVKYLGLLKPELLGSDFTHLEYIRRPTRRDLGKKLLYRDAFMTGWAYKTVTNDDLKFPLVYGDGKRSRVLATIGVTRGFGDHELKAQASNVDIKPFLTSQPEVKVFDVENCDDLTDSDVLIMGTDGLWDVTSNESAAETVNSALKHFPVDDTSDSTDSSSVSNRNKQYRYISAAQDLVMSSRGKQRDRGKGWKTQDNKVATIDDISVFVIPLKGYQEEYQKWKEARDIVQRTPQASLSQAMLK